LEKELAWHTLAIKGQSCTKSRRIEDPKNLKATKYIRPPVIINPCSTIRRKSKYIFCRTYISASE